MMNIHREKLVPQFDTETVLQTIDLRKALRLNSLAKRLRNDATQLINMFEIQEITTPSRISENESLIFSLYDLKASLHHKITAILCGLQRGLGYDTFMTEWNTLTHSELAQGKIYEASGLAIFILEVEPRVATYEVIATEIEKSHL